MTAPNCPNPPSNSSGSTVRRLHDDLHAHTRDLVNERGGSFEIGYWVYREFMFWGEKLKSTPDGRHDGDLLAQGLNPSRLHPISDITSAMNSVAALDLTQCACAATMDVQLPAGDVNPLLLEQFERAFAASKLQTLQLNCVDKEALLDAGCIRSDTRTWWSGSAASRRSSCPCSRNGRRSS